jgi:hypothetical protein
LNEVLRAGESLTFGCAAPGFVPPSPTSLSVACRHHIPHVTILIRHIWLYLLISPTLAISVAFPLFLIARQRVIAQQRVELATHPGLSDAP